MPSEPKSLGRREIEKAAEALDLPGIFEAAKVAAAEALSADVSAPKAQANGDVAPDVIEPYLQHLRIWLEQRIGERAQVFSSSAWLWYLRNSPAYLLAGGGKVSFLYPAAIAEAASATSQTSGSPRGFGWNEIAYEVSNTTIEQVARLAAESHLLLYVQERIRLNRRGASWKLSGPWPKAVLNDDLQNALGDYDARLSKAGSSYTNRTGTVILRQFDGDPREAPEGTALFVLPVSEPTLTDMHLGALGAEQEIYATHAVHPVGLDGLRNFNQQIVAKWWSDAVPATLALLVSAFRRALGDWGAVQQLHSTGFWTIRTADAKRFMDEVLESGRRVVETSLPGSMLSSADELLEVLSVINARLWPVENQQIIRTDDDCLTLDLAAASRALDHGLQFAGVADTDYRDRHFESAIQATVDTTAWSPSDELRMVPRRQLRRDGEMVAEVDAIAEKGRQIVLLDGRGTAYTDAFETGEGNAVRNALGQLEAKATRMVERLELLRSNPKGDNYDFRGRELLGAVVTAVPIYTAHPDARRSEYGLPAVLALGELAAWLETH